MAKAPLSAVTALKNGLIITFSDDDFVKKSNYWFLFEDSRKTNWSFRIENGNKYLSPNDRLKNYFCVAVTTHNLDDESAPAICTLYVMTNENTRALFINGKFGFYDAKYSTEIVKGQEVILPESL